MSFGAQFISDNSFTIDPGESLWFWWNFGGTPEASFITLLPDFPGTIQCSTTQIASNDDGTTTYSVLGTNATDQVVTVQIAIYQFGIFPGNL